MKNLTFKIVLLLVVLLYTAIVGSFSIFQERFFFLPESLEGSYKFNFENQFEEGNFSPDTASKINYIHFKVSKPKGHIVYFHGNSDNLDRWGKEVSYLVDLQYDVWMMDYRTFGKSKGELSEENFYSDAKAFYELVTSKTEGENKVLMGRSLGCTFATYIASLDTPELLILEAPFYSLKDLLKTRFPFLPVNNVLNYEFPTYSYAGDVKCPVLLLHGTEDETILIEQGMKLFKVFTNSESQFLTLEGIGHKNFTDSESYNTAINDLLGTGL